MRRFPAPLLVLLAALADSVDAHGLARNALLLAVPFVAVNALESFGGYLDRRNAPFLGAQTFLWAIVLALLVFSCAVRSGAANGVPPIAFSSLGAAVLLLVAKLLLYLAPHARRLSDFLPAKP